MYKILYHKSITGYGSIDGTYKCSQPIYFNPNKKHYLKLKYASITNTIPNICTGLSNNSLKVSNDNGATYTTITLSNGIYDINALNLAIKDVVSAWDTDVSDPTFQLLQNEYIQKVYCVIDSSKLAVGTQFVIDFSLSDISTLLGCITTKIFNTDGTFEFSHYPQVNYTGARIFVNINNLVMNNNYFNGSPSRYICTIPKNSTDQELVTPGSDNMTYDYVELNMNSLSELEFSFIGSLNRSIYLLEGEVFVELEIREL